MKKIALILLIISFGQSLKARDFNQQRREFVLMNIGINAVVGGVGALINKGKYERPLSVFAKGFGQGCLGGSFQVLGKDLTYQIKSKQNLGYAWAARITGAIGNSIMQNAASNINFWERWHFNLALFRFDYSIADKRFQARLFPSSIYGIIVAGRQATFNLKKTFQTGILIFESDGPVHTLDMYGAGIGIVSSIAYDQNVTGKRFYDLMAHETMHILQYDNMVYINPMFIKFDTKLKAKNSLYRTASKYIYFDFNGIVLYGLYVSQIGQPWHCRYFEREAEHFSQRITMPNCK